MEFIAKTVVLIVVLTYIVWGFIFGVHSLLVVGGSVSAKKWAKYWYGKKGYLYECYVFFPMIYFVYILFEFLPAILGLDREFKPFDFTKISDTSFFEER